MSFRRALGLFGATTVVVGAIIGAGMFINLYHVAQRLLLSQHAHRIDPGCPARRQISGEQRHGR